MKMAGFGWRKAALELRLELGGRVVREGRTDAMGDEVRIGRAADCEWRIPPTDKTASNHHARLYRKRGKWWVEDTGSRNGLYCKGEKVASWCLAAGDQVSIGDCVLIASSPEDRAEGKAEHHRLEQLNGADAGRTVELDRETTVIGSAATCDIACDDNLVSHRHAELTCKRDGTCWVKDLKSRNGTRVNRVPLKAAGRMLRDGDVLSVAYVDFRFWDKNTVHTPSHVRLRLAVAAMTVLVCLAGWFFWNAAHPSAAHLLKLAVKQAEKGQFREALHLTEESRLARHHAAYAPQIEERMRDILAWQSTAIAWEAAQENLEHGRWIWARESFTKTLKWDWNTDSAMRHQRRAQASERLLEAFLEMRSLLETPSASAADLEKARNGWTKALAQAESEPAMRDAAWENSFVAEAGEGDAKEEVRKNATHRNVWAPLQQAGTAIAEEIATALKENDDFLECLKALSAPDIRILSRPAETCRDEIKRLYGENQKRKESRTADWQAKKYKTLRFAPLLENRATGIWDALDDLAAAEAAVARNLETIAALEPGWERQLEKDLDFPTHTDEPAVLAYQRLLATTNAHLCMKVASQLKNTHLAALAELGMDDPDRVPVAIGRVMNPGTMAELLRFVDFTQPPRRWAAGGVLEGCAYDELLGCEYVCDFLDAYEDGEDFLADRTPSVLKDEESACPVARRAREDFILLKRFLDFTEKEPLLANAAAAKRLEGGKPNKLRQYRKKAEALLDERKEKLAEWLSATRRPGRDGVAATVLCLMLETDRWNEELRGMHRAAHDEYLRLFKERVQMARMRRGDEEYLRNCVPDSFWFREWQEYAEDRSARRRP